MANKKWKYHTSHFYIQDNGDKVNVLTELYQVGVYGIINGDSALQFNWKASDLVRTEKKLKIAESKGEITELVFGRPITVTIDDDGFYIELKTNET